PEKLIPSQSSTIAIKPNLVVADKPEGGATTHPEIVIAIIEYLKERGFHNISIVESAWVADSTKRAFEVNGYYGISSKYDVRLVDVKDDAYVTKTIHGVPVEFSKTIMETDFLISLPVLKGHCQTSMTCALKNMKGCISDRSKRHSHTLGIHKPIAALNAIRSADLIIVDSLNGDLDFEEGGNPVRTDRIFACRDSVLCDAYGASLMGFETEEIEYIRLAEQFGVGTKNLDFAHIIFLNEPSEIAPPPRPTGKAIYLNQYIDSRSACSACHGSLVHALKRLDEANQLAGRFDQKICVGQEFKTVQDPDRIGVGICTRGLGKSMPGCPPTALAMLEFLKSLNMHKSP
ncbi:MAG: DUF362 domain-containing protein, partial [Sphaerochaeta sp.]